ncbi:FKBP-type peptidyl-prolyl cis-trans isomerase [Thiothrix unzii]|uniref:FKBP-type peptidyl-prolyl cis-trans isomerase n=1 Tax=Thiothrix unzii TaxID=111769 RepID=UPI001FE77DDC|nr:FKBP-type peptidyl-prolyl cis-trans isomerase [Thiothrix unzii]
MKTTTLLALAVALSGSVFMAACSDKTATTSTTGTSSPQVTDIKMVDLVKTDVKVGDGAEATAGKMVSVHYTGWLYDEAAADKHGKKFDSSRDRGQPFQFPLAGGQVIKGWDEGVQGMKIGGQRTLIIPAEMGYGARGAGGVIPPNATLVFDVELLGVN